MILIDNPDSNGWSHLVASSIQELHEFAGRIGLNRCWYQNKRKRYQPHYDIKGDMRIKAIDHGAILIQKRSDIILFLKNHYNTIA